MRRTVLVLLGAAAVSLTAPTGTAQAVPGLVFDSAFSAMDTAVTKTTIVECPAGTTTLGGGYFVSGGAGGRITIARAYVQSGDGPGRYLVTATEAIDGNPGAWKLYVYATCATAPAGLTYVTGSSVNNSESGKNATATCPAGKKIISAGVRVTGGAGQVNVDDVVPTGNLTMAAVTAYEDSTGFAGDWFVTAHAVCANPLPGLTLAMADTKPADSVNDSVGVTCPPGTKLVSVGGAVTGGLGHVLYAGLYPSADLTSAALLTVEQTGGYASTWYSRVHAVCAT